jgi:amino acid transporter
MRVATIITNVGSILGTFVPGILIIGLGSLWVATGRRSNVELSFAKIIPELSGPAQLVLFLNVMLGFAGLEMSASHAGDVKNPQRDFPRAILLSSLLIFALSVLGSMAIAIAIPAERLTLETGVIDTVDVLLTDFGLKWLSPVVAGMMIFGMVAWFVTWVSGPPRGMLATAKTGNLPLILQKVNPEGMPSAIMIFQALVITLASFIFVLVPSVETCFWILVAISTQASLLMYILMYISAIILRYKYPDVVRGYRVPFGNIGMITVGVIGAVVCLVCYFIGFIPPDGFEIGNTALYVAMVVVGNLLVVVLPFILSMFRKPQWKKEIIIAE